MENLNTDETRGGADARDCVPRLVRLYGNDAGPVMWNPWNKVVQDHRDGTIHHDATNEVREALGLKVPWTPEMADDDTKTKGVFLEPNHT